jgi:WhiB family redox-sensing transcriptional regulator
MPRSDHALDTPRGEHWTDHARCREADPELWFPTRDDRGDSGELYAEARRICGWCEVRPECLAHALGRDDRYGMWGGLTPKERARLAKAVA